jgi:hypothetical protein
LNHAQSITDTIIGPSSELGIHSRCDEAIVAVILVFFDRWPFVRCTRLLNFGYSSRRIGPVGLEVQWRRRLAWADSRRDNQLLQTPSTRVADELTFQTIAMGEIHKSGNRIYIDILNQYRRRFAVKATKYDPVNLTCDTVAEFKRFARS